MNKDIYVLCFKAKTIDGKEDIYAIYESNLKNIDMYTSYKLCFSKNDLFKCFPNQVRNFINSNFQIKISNDINGEFFIRKKCKNIRKGRTDLEVLYKMDSDIVYAKESDVYYSLCEMKLSDEDEDKIINIKKDFINEAYKMLFNKESELSYKVDSNIGEKGVTSNRIDFAFSLTSNLIEISRYVCKDYKLKRSFLILLKSYKKKINDLKGIRKTTLVCEKDLNERIEKRSFSFTRAKENMISMLALENKYFSLKHPKEKKDEINLIHAAEKKHPQNFNEDLANYLEKYSEDEENKDNFEQYEDEEYDDFLGPKGPNDSRYWSIN